ncbi:adenylosuccinate lyase [Mesoterricola silvestris]|uniref:Adenylosuccinate lyase n=1 Tax=Mesoterricola silvestris TaxID=2927979 RepID=A0AA48K792_9BACT|nr:adenylosuccinate lyase [Mesoterricola silvestris]BDU70836.1 adenylosuccinate lyase [Mesoterricola silvestris]
MPILPPSDARELESFEHPLASRYASKAMVRLLSPLYRMRVWRRLWIALAESESEMGLPVTVEQIAEMRATQDAVDLEAIARFEASLRHDVMAAIHAWGEQAPSARPIIHLGATSCFVTDNGDLLIAVEALRLIRRRLQDVIACLRDFAAAWQDQACLGFTHFQPAQPTTVGKRATLWIQDLLLDLEDLDHLLRTTPVRGLKGVTGTQASFLELLDGDGARVEALEARFCEKVGSPAIPVSGQTATRKLEDRMGQVLCGIAASASKFGCDLRLLQHLKEVEEPFEKNQIGSSAMPYKRNPMRSERIVSLARFVTGLLPSSYQTTATQWMERTLDDSAHRRLTLSQGLLAVDAILVLYRNVASGLVVYPRMIEARLASELPFMAAELLLMEGVKRGGDRQDLHERFRVASMEAGRRIKEEGQPNTLLRLLAEDPAWNMNETELAGILDARRFTGRAGEQVRAFLARDVAAALADHLPADAASVRV